MPLRREDLSQIIDNWAANYSLSGKLLDVYPLPVKGIYCFQFDSIVLNLIFMRLDQALAEFEPKGKALFDCLLLDGFAPAKNETMWHPVSLRRLGYLCKQGATFSTFTAASKVRHCLIHCGFSVTRQKGFGRKREMLNGTMDRHKVINFKPRAPWYHYSTDNGRITTPIVIVGGGVAGCATAFALASHGIKSHIIEQAATAGGTAAGLKRSLYSPSLSADFNLASQFYWHAYHHLQQYLLTAPQIHQQCGIFFIADSGIRKKYLSAAYRMLDRFNKDFVWLEKGQSMNHTGISINYPGLFTSHGGWLDGQQFCNNLVNDSHIRLQTNTTVTALTHEDGGWLVNTDKEPVNSTHVILCSGWATGLIDNYNLCRLETIRGQTTSLPMISTGISVKAILNNGHYLIPALDSQDEMIVGASFEKKTRQIPGPSISADIENLTAIRHINPVLSTLIDHQIKRLGNYSKSNSDSGVRLTTRDHLPLIGPVPDMQFYRDNYPQIIQSGRLKECPDPQFAPGLFVNTAHGSRGVTASILAGSLISSQVTGSCSPLPSSLCQAVHPARFFVRDQVNKNRFTAIYSPV